MDNLTKLKLIMNRHGLTPRQVSIDTGCKLTTVYSWFKTKTGKRPVEDPVIKSLTNLYGELE
jgi:hypothetical protein